MISWLLDMLQLTHGEATPMTPEARRVLCFFATSLHNPNMPTADWVACTRSMTTLTPHYGEDVMYALSKGAAEQEMGVSALSGGDDNTFLLNLRGEHTEVKSEAAAGAELRERTAWPTAQQLYGHSRP